MNLGPIVLACALILLVVLWANGRLGAMANAALPPVAAPVATGSGAGSVTTQ